jgi:uncharacterized protein
MVQTPYMDPTGITDAHRTAAELQVQLKTVSLDTPKELHTNPPDRCYRCKKHLYTAMLNSVRDLGYRTIVDGTNADDLQQHRPGISALRELHIPSPLARAGLTKNEVRELLRLHNLPYWDKPSGTCLLSRIPYNTTIEAVELERIAQAEAYLHQHGFRQVRVRSYSNSAHIEVGTEERIGFFDEAFMDKTAAVFKELGFLHVFLDVEGYKTGKMDRG